jgi:hypothetical protein
MSEVALFEGQKMPAHLQDGELSDVAKALGAKQGGDGLKRISFRGGVFRMMVGSKEAAQNDDRSMNVIIVKAGAGYARTYYDAPYKEGVISTPACWSDNGETPSSNCENPQSNMCATCPQNVKGSGNGNAKACSFAARLAVVLEGDQKGDVYGVQFPAMSIWGECENEKYESLQNYVKKLATFGYDVAKVVTEMRFDTNSAVPKLMFRAVRPLEADEYENAKLKAKAPEAESHTGERKFTKSEEEDGKKLEALFDGSKETTEEVEAEEPKKVAKKKAEPVKAEKAVEDILDEWGDD